MKLLPFENIDYETKLAAEEIRNPLAADIEPWKVFKLSTNPGKKYEGRLDGNRFKISRIIDYVTLSYPISPEPLRTTA